MSERKCIVTGQICSPDTLLRFARAPANGEVVPDLRNELPGRGVWIYNQHDLVAKAAKRNLFARGFREPCVIPADLEARVARRLDELALSYLSLAKKAGQAVGGFEKVDALISSGRIGVLMGAWDGSPNGRGKLKQRLASNGTVAVVIECFTSGQLGLALGRTNVIHAAMAIGGLAEKFVIAVRRAEKYRGSADQGALDFEDKA